MPWQHQGADRSTLGGAERRTTSAGERQGVRARRAPRDKRAQSAGGKDLEDEGTRVPQGSLRAERASDCPAGLGKGGGRRISHLGTVEGLSLIHI
eukprot:11111373-Alexandrium_andersonii.AAC.1